MNLSIDLRYSYRHRPLLAGVWWYERYQCHDETVFELRLEPIEDEL